MVSPLLEVYFLLQILVLCIFRGATGWQPAKLKVTMSGNLRPPPLSSVRQPASDLVDDVAFFSYDWSVTGNLQEDSSEPSSTTASESSNPLYDSHVDTAKQTPHPKIAIPRAANTKPLAYPGRVSRACVNCRDQKVKCSGHRPTCHRCQMSAVTCIYGDRKREKMVKCVVQIRCKYTRI